MKSIGYIFRFIEEVFFLGIVSLLVSLIAFGADFKVIMNSALQLKSFTDYFNAYMFFSLFGYPIVLLLSILVNKYIDLYQWKEKKRSTFELILKTLFDNATFSFRIIFKFLGIFFDDVDNTKQVGSILMFSLWIVNIIFIIMGMMYSFR
ncbi:MAG: hypothetical protein IKL88_01390 [Erysipelotrichales bacterium]|nr:hypothetical protein [Erysipelotrichales bacterium]